MSLAAIREKMAYTDVPQALAGIGYHLHHGGADGHGLYVFLRFKYLKGKE